MGTPLYVISYEVARELGEPVGELEMVTDLITGTSIQNPATAQTNLRKRAREMGITNVFEVETERKSNHYVSFGKGYAPARDNNPAETSATSQNS